MYWTFESESVRSKVSEYGYTGLDPKYALLATISDSL